MGWPTHCPRVHSTINRLARPYRPCSNLWIQYSCSGSPKQKSLSQTASRESCWKENQSVKWTFSQWAIRLVYPQWSRILEKAWKTLPWESCSENAWSLLTTCVLKILCGRAFCASCLSFNQLWHTLSLEKNKGFACKVESCVEMEIFFSLNLLIILFYSTAILDSFVISNFINNLYNFYYYIYIYINYF